MESPATAEVPHAASGTQFGIFGTYPATGISALVSNMIQSGAVDGADPSPSVAMRTPRMSTRLHPPQVDVASRRPSSGAGPRLPRPERAHGPSGLQRSSMRAVDRVDGTDQVDSTRGGPNTRSRKRRAEPKSAPGSGASVRKRARTKPTASLKKPPPGSLNDDEKKLPPAENSSCCICMCEPEAEELAMVNGCEHRFCFGCIEKWAARENTCPLCKKRFVKIDRVNKQRKRKGSKNTKKVRQRDQRSDFVPGAALEGLLANFTSSRQAFAPQSIARLIFSTTGLGVGNGIIEFNGPPPSLRGRSVARAMSSLEDSLVPSEGDDDESGFTGLFRAVHGRSVVMGGGMSVVRPIAFGTAPASSSRSYATNMNDRTAGNGAENPLEIEDDSDEEVEVVQVTRPS